MARLIVGRVLRRGLCEMMTETMQLSLLRDFSSPSASQKWNRHQYQIALVEISHLVSTLGEGCASALDELIPLIQQCLAHPDHGVRHEAAIAFQAIAVAFPSSGRKYIMSMVDEIQVHHDEILALAVNRNIVSISSSDMEENSTKRTRRFRRKQEKSPSNPSSPLASSHGIHEKSLDHQYALHGNALVLSLILHVMPRLPGGLPAELVDIIIAVADNLISSQGNGMLSQSQPGAIVTCVSAGYRIVSGALTMGVKPTLMHLKSIFSIWSKSAAFIDGDLTRMGPMHDICCLEPFLNSIVVFLRVSSELLLSVPDALNRTTQVLEKVLPIVMGYSQLEHNESSLTMSTRLNSTKAAIMEAFAWLPPGSFPLVADSVFSFASHQIKVGTENGISCGLLSNLVTREDDLVEIRSRTHAHRLCETGDDQLMNDSIMALTVEYVDHSQRETVLHFLPTSETNLSDSSSQIRIRDIVTLSAESNGPPTPLHEVGTWREPPFPSKSSNERLMNAAVHVFAATFALQGGHQQITAIHMMEDLVESGNSGTINHITSTNITATLLSCLKALPVDEMSSEGNKGAGPPWMSRSVQLFLKLMKSSQSPVRRGAAEGLGLLASVGMKGGFHALHSSIMLSLEDMMQQSTNENTIQQKQAYESALRKQSGCLLTLGCINRRFYEEKSNENNSHSKDTSAPVETMLALTRMLPFTAIHIADEDSYLLRTHAIQSLNSILSHSMMNESIGMFQEESSQVLLKAIEIIENNFFGAWKSNTTEVDERSYEVSLFFSVVIDRQLRSFFLLFTLV